MNDLQQRYIDTEDPDTLSMGIFGYLADIHSTILQNSAITTGELGNELFPARAKFERNVTNHAIIHNIENINAQPAIMPSILGIFEEDLDNYMENDKFILDKEISINIEEYEFHTQYDIIVRRSYLANNEIGYSAVYDMSINNPLSTIRNPYLLAPFRQKYSGKWMIFFYVDLMQVSHAVVEKTVLSSSLIENRTLIFTYDNQLADFVVKVTEGDSVIYLTPVFEGMGLEGNLKYFCYYTYPQANTVRVRFDSLSYVPKVNAKIEVLIKTTLGSEGNFEYTMATHPILSSDRFNYKSVYATIIPAAKSSGGYDKKSTDELRRMLPKESLARGSISCYQDLENYFNMLNSDDNRIIIQKRVDNQFERSYFAYMLMKDTYGNVSPTNTFDIKLAVNDFDVHDNRKYVLKPGCYIKYNNIDDNSASVIKRTDDNSSELDKLEGDDKTNFIYTTPFLIVVNADPLYTSFYLNIIDKAIQTNFSYVNVNSLIQFICSNVRWTRSFNNDPNTYTLKFSFAANTSFPMTLIEVDSNNEVMVNRLKVFAVFYNNGENVPYAYAECKYLSGINEDDNVDVTGYVYKLQLTTEDVISDDNKIYMHGLTRVGASAQAESMLLSPHTEVRLYICVNIDDTYGEFGRYDLDSIVPGLEGYTVSNMYTIDGGLDFYENYSEIISSQVKDIKIEGEYTSSAGFHLMRVPCLRRSYACLEENIQNFVENLNYKKAYIDKALYVLEDNFLIDFKFFNTYGPSRIYTLDREAEKLIDRVNLTLNFELKLVANSDKNTKDYILKDIKDIIEDLNNISSLHIPNLITTITNKYRESIEYIEFKGTNEYGPGVQHLYRQDFNVLTGTQDVNMVPEFLTVHTNLDMSPDIEINVITASAHVYYTTT